jgi:hypothetical protein
MKAMASRAALSTLLWGAGIGLIVLGVGGRVVMRMIAESTGAAPAFTLGGTFTVVMLGALSGAAGALILVVARALLRRWSPLPTVFYWGLLVLITLRGLRPLDQQRLVLFLPLVALFGALLQWRTWRYRRVVQA